MRTYLPTYRHFRPFQPSFPPICLFLFKAALCVDYTNLPIVFAIVLMPTYKTVPKSL